jgi:hypothetical protein
VKKLAHELKVRRDHLPEAAERYYRIVMSQADVYGSHGDDTVIAVRDADGMLEVDAGPRFQARFDPKQTDEVRLYLFGGADRVLVRGTGDKGPRLVIGGGPGDVVVDSSGSGRVTVHDAADVKIDTPGKVKREKDPLLPPSFTDTVVAESPPLKRTHVSFSPWLDLNSDLGLFIGGGPVLTSYDYGYEPYKSKIRVRAAYATAPGAFDVDFMGEFRRKGKSSYFLVDAEASAVEVLKFFGYGNETTRISNDDFYNTASGSFWCTHRSCSPSQPRAR